MAERAGLAKAALYFDGVASHPPEAIAATAMARAAEIAASLPAGVAQRFARRITAMPTLPHQRVMAASPRPFTFAYQLSTSHADAMDAMTAAVEAMAAMLDDAIDRGNAAVLVGREIAITRGDGPVYNIMPLRRLPGMAHEEFMHHWFDRHAALGEGVEGVRYRQNHVDQRATSGLAARTGLSFPPMDGLTESYFDTLDAAVALLSREEVAIGAIEDERRFIDHDRSQFALYETLWRN